MQGDAELAERHFRMAVRADGSDARVRNWRVPIPTGALRRCGGAARTRSRGPGQPEPTGRLRESRSEPEGGDRRGARSAFTRAGVLERRMPISLLELAEISYLDDELEASADWYQRYRGVAPR